MSDTSDQDGGGVGIYQSSLSPDEMQAAKIVQSYLCDAATSESKNEVQEIDPATLYTVVCQEQGTLISRKGKLHELSRQAYMSAEQYFLNVRNRHFGEGHSIVKFDVRLDRIERRENSFAYKIAFRNSGDLPITMKAPDIWGRAWKEKLTIRAKGIDGTEWDVNLLGAKIENKADFPSDTISIAPRSEVVVSFLAVPTVKVKHGTYQVDTFVVTSITGASIVATMGKVSFHSDYKNPTKVIVTHPLALSAMSACLYVLLLLALPDKIGAGWTMVAMFGVPILILFALPLIVGLTIRSTSNLFYSVTNR